MQLRNKLVHLLLNRQLPDGGSLRLRPGIKSCDEVKIVCAHVQRKSELLHLRCGMLHEALKLDDDHEAAHVAGIAIFLCAESITRVNILERFEPVNLVVLKTL